MSLTDYKLLSDISRFSSLFKLFNPSIFFIELLFNFSIHKFSNLSKFSIFSMQLLWRNKVLSYVKLSKFSIFLKPLLSNHKVFKLKYGSKFYILLKPLKCRYSFSFNSGNSYRSS